MIHDDRKWLLAAVSRLTKQQEQPREQPWYVGMAPHDFVGEQLDHILGIEVRVTRLSARFKVSAAETEADRLGARDGVRSEAAGRHTDTLVAAMSHPPQFTSTP